MSGFNQLGKRIVDINRDCFHHDKSISGLHRDDCLYENDDVKEAIRRLPQQLYDERNYRIIRALNLSMTKTILPKDQWTKYEDDFKYLEPYLKEVEKERAEKTEWNTK
jgi:ubiquinol-cytochrome c reductase subunit 7